MKRTLLLLLLCLTGTGWATVGTQTYTVTYTCTGGYGPFAFTFPISVPAALTVTMNGVLLPSTDYTIVPVNNNYNNGGSVTLGASFPCGSGWPIILTRVTPLTQTVKFYDNMPIPFVTFERVVDKLTEIVQEIVGSGGGGGGISLTGAAPIVVTPNPITGIGVVSCPTCGTNTLVVAGSVGDGQINNGAGNLAPMHLNDNGTTMTVNESITPKTAASVALGTAPLPFTDLYVGTSANHSFHFDTSTVAANYAVAVPNANSNTVQGIANPSDTNVVNYVSTDGVQHRIAQAVGTVTNVSGTANQVNVATGTTTPVISLSSTLVLPGTFTMGAFAANLGSATSLKVPSYAGGVTAADGVIAFDSTTGAKNFHGFTGGVDHLLVSAATTPANADCPVWVVSGANVLLGSSGAPCSGGSGTVNSGTASHLAYYATSAAAISDMGADFTFTTHTLTMGASGILDLHSGTTSGFLLSGSYGSGLLRVTTTTGAIASAELSGDVTTSGSNATTLANTAVTPGSYTNTNLTVDSKGRITTASNGSGGGITSVAVPGDVLSPTTCTGPTCTFAKQNVSAGYVAAGPQSGTTLVPFPNSVPAQCTFTTTTSTTCTLNSATSTHDYIYVLVYVSGCAQANAVSDSASQSYTMLDNSNNNFCTNLWAFQNSVAGVTSVTVNLPSSQSGWVTVGTIANVLTTGGSAVDAVGHQNSGTCSGGIVALGSITAAGTHDIILGLGSSNASFTFSPIAPFSTIPGSAFTSGSISYAGMYYNATTAGSFTPSSTCVGNPGSVQYTLALLPAVTSPTSQWGFRPLVASDLNFATPVYSASGAFKTSSHTVIDSCTLGTSCSVTLAGAAAFTNSASYQCTGTDQTSAAAVKFAPSSGSAFALTGTGTDVIGYICIGN